MYSSVSSPPSHSPTSPSTPVSRPSRLRGLSHLLSRDHSSRPSTLTRATSYPTPTSPATPGTPTQGRATDLSPARSHPEGSGTSNGWTSPSLQNGETRATTQSVTTDLTNDSSSAIATPMARARSGTASDTGDQGSNGQAREAAATNGEVKGMAHQLPSIRFTAHQAPGAQRPSLVFSPMSRILPTGREIIKVGRYSERDNQPQQPANVPSSASVGFKSKVVSRRHCEFWYSSGRWYIKDVKSSSGTFLNHIRLSSPGTESRPFPLNDGDIVQLGIDFKGGEEMIFRCVKIRVELNKGWQSGPSSFNVQSHKRLRELSGAGKTAAAGGSSQDCAICLGPIAPCQSLFVAPCSHTWHYKCIRVIINGPMYPHFVCPNCRAVADLEAELDDPYANGEWEQVPEEASAEQGENVPSPPVVTRPESGGVLDVAIAGVSLQESARQDSDIELPDVSDSDARPTAPDGRYEISRDTPSPISDAVPEETSSSTVPPVDIAPRRSTSEAQNGLPSHLQRVISGNGRSGTRTPSPNGLPNSSSEGILNGDGPMTPRNDIGPFVFDGSAGRLISTIGAISPVAEAVDTPKVDATSQPPSQAPSGPQSQSQS